MKRIIHISKLGLFFGFCLLYVLSTTCVKDNRDSVPYVPVDLILDLSTDLAYLGVGETATITPHSTGGIISFQDPRFPNIILGGQIVYPNGIIIFREDVYDYRVFDITCTFQAQTDFCSLHRSDFDGVFDCDCCGSRFLVTFDSDGVVFKGPAAMPLKPYNSFLRNNQLHIKN